MVRDILLFFNIYLVCLNLYICIMNFFDVVEEDIDCEAISVINHAKETKEIVKGNDINYFVIILLVVNV